MKPYRILRCLLIGTCVALIASKPSVAQTVTYSVTGEVVNLRGGSFPGIDVGNAITGTLIIDTSLADSDPHPQMGNFQFAARFDIQIEGFSFGVSDRMLVRDGPTICCGPFDRVDLDSGHDGVGPSFGSYAFGNISSIIGIASDSVIASSTVYDGLQLLNSFGADGVVASFLFVDSVAGRSSRFDGVVTYQLVTAPVPEPEGYALALSSLGLIGLFAGRRKYRKAALRTGGNPRACTKVPATSGWQ